MTFFYCHLLLLFVLAFPLLIAKVIEQSANDTQHKEARELAPTASAGAPLLAAMIATNRFNTARTYRIIPKTFIAFTFKEFVMFVIYPLCGKTRKG